MKPLTEAQLHALECICEHNGADLRGGMSWRWGVAPSKVEAWLVALEKRALATRHGHTFLPTDNALLAYSFYRLGRKIARFVRHVQEAREHAESVAKRDAAILARCNAWLDSKTDVPARLCISAEDLVAFLRGEQ